MSLFKVRMLSLQLKDGWKVKFSREVPLFDDSFWT